MENTNDKSHMRKFADLTDNECRVLGTLIGAASYGMIKGDFSHLEVLFEYVLENHIDLFNGKIVSMQKFNEAEEGGE